MGQYYVICNITKKEFITPHKIGDGAKLMEFCGGLVSSLLTILLSDGNGRGGGDLMSDDPIIGSWAGDKIVVTGDYADKKKFIKMKECKGIVINGIQKKYNELNLYNIANHMYKDISIDALFALLNDGSTREELNNKYASKILKELILIKNTSKDNLPTIIMDIKTNDGKRILEREIRNESE